MPQQTSEKNIIEPQTHGRTSYGFYELPTDVSAYKIESMVFQTEKAYLFSNEGVVFWIPKSVIVKVDVDNLLVYTYSTVVITEAMPRN